MRVLFIYPSIDCPPGVNHGLVSLSAVLKAKGHDTRLIHVCDKLWPVPSTEEILDIVREYKPGLIGFSVMSQQFEWTREKAQALKEAFDIPLVIGGVHCTMVPDEVVACPEFDYVCVGEGDFALAELVERLENGGDTTTVPNMRIPRPAEQGGPIVNKVDAFPNINELPPLDYDLFELGEIIDSKNGWMGLITSRGCPYKCTYCFNKEIVDLYKEDRADLRTSSYLRTFSVPRMIDEIRDLKTRFPQINTLIFDDDLFTLNKNYVFEFCEAYKASGIRLPFVVNAHVQRFDLEMAKALKEAGCMIVKYGLESGCNRVRKEVLWRHMTNATIEKSFAAAHEYDLHTSAFIMFGLPTETREEIEETLDLCARIKMGRFRWAIFFPFPGTAGYRISQDMDLIDFEKMKDLGNYFDGSCLKFGDTMDLYIEKLGVLCNWYVNARTDWESAPIYQDLVDKVEAMDRDTFRGQKDALLRHDKALSDELMAKGITHYTIRYANVMGVRSDFVKREQQRLKGAPEWTVAYSDYTLD